MFWLRASNKFGIGRFEVVKLAQQIDILRRAGVGHPGQDRAASFQHPLFLRAENSNEKPLMHELAQDLIDGAAVVLCCILRVLCDGPPESLAGFVTCRSPHWSVSPLASSATVSAAELLAIGFARVRDTSSRIAA